VGAKARQSKEYIVENLPFLRGMPRTFSLYPPPPPTPDPHAPSLTATLRLYTPVCIHARPSPQHPTAPHQNSFEAEGGGVGSGRRP